MSEECRLNDNFAVTCDVDSPKPFYGDANITGISLDGELRVLTLIARRCFDNSGINTATNLWLAKFSFNDTLNKFVVVGCDSFAYLRGIGVTTRCMSICSEGEVDENGACDGVGCCQTPIRKNMLQANLTVGSFNNHSEVKEFNPCTYAFLIEDARFRFSTKNFTNLQYVEKLPVVLAWTIGNETCEEAKKNTTSYACQANSSCYDMPDGYSGYRCSCLEGYDGNPYLGCKDIDECGDICRNNCTVKERCKNTAWNYTCSCPKGYSGDGWGEGGCKKENIEIAYIVIVRFTKRNEADSPSSPRGSKRLKAAVQGSPVHEQQLAVTVPTVADSRPLTAGPPRRRKLVATTDLAGEGGRSSDPPAQLDGLSLVEGSRRYVEWLGQEVRKLEGEKGQSAEQLTAAKAKLKKANAEVKAVKAELAAQVAKTAEEAAEVERLKAELEVAKGQLKATSGRLKATSSQLKATSSRLEAVTEGQGGMLRAYTKRLLLSDHFTGLAGDLAGLINGNAVLEALEKVAKDYPGLDASKYGYKRLEGAAEYTQYARVVRRHLGHLPLLDGLASSPELLTAGMVEACPIDREADLEAAFDALPEEDKEMEEAGAGAGEERAEIEPSSSKAAEETGGVEEEAPAEKQPTPEEKQPTPEKEVGDS